jgi:hypothetical protein
VNWHFELSLVFIHELMFLVGGMIIGATIMLIVMDRFEKRMLDQHVSQVDGLLGRINELTMKRGTSDPSVEPSALSFRPARVRTAGINDMSLELAGVSACRCTGGGRRHWLHVRLRRAAITTRPGSSKPKVSDLARTDSEPASIGERATERPAGTGDATSGSGTRPEQGRRLH